MKLKLENKISTIDFTRRDFLTMVSLAGAASFFPIFLDSCSKTVKYSGTGQVPFKVWEEMLQAIITSSDYLPGRMERLIASKDLKAMYHFVKDEIVLIPTRSNSLYGMGTKIKWGIPGVLRCGMATPREKAELLSSMYQKSGIESKVVFEGTRIKPEEVPAFFYRPVTRNFNPVISESQFRTWANEMGYSKELMSQFEIQKDYTEEANSLGEKILKKIEYFDKYARPFDFRWDNFRTPTVEFIDKGVTKYAHLFDPKIPFGKLKNDYGGKTSQVNPVEENKEEIALKISYRNNIKPAEEIELISGKWKAADLIGKQILINFLHGLTLEEQAVTPLGNVRIFTPALALQSLHESAENMSEQSFLGDPFTIDGKRIKIDKEEKVYVDGNVLINKPKSDLQKKVIDLKINTSVAGYPIVKVNVIAKDSSGNFVEGLSTRDFVFTEDGKPVSALMENNQQTPKILILSDTSLSMPTEYREKGMMEFNESLKSNILEKYPSAVITFWETPSSLFTWLLKASQTGYDLIIFATDGDNVDVYDDNNFSVYRAGPPAIVLNVKNSTWKTHTETFEKMANITNGLVINEKDQTKVLEEITKRIDAFEVPPYVFSYASADSSKKHTVRVSVDNNRINTTATYQFPETGIQSGNRIIGIYLEITVGRKQPIKRVLAGFDFKNEIYDSDKDYYLEIEGLLFGGALLAIEGEGPTLSMSISELLKSKLSNRDWGEAFQDGDIEKTKEEIQKGILAYPAMLIPLMAPLQNQITNESLTFPAGYRMCLLKTRVGIDKPTIFSFDYLPTSDYATIANDKVDSFTTTLLKTAQFSIRETALFQRSTYTSLQKSELIDRNSAYRDNWIRNRIPYENKYYKYWAEEVFRGDLTYKIFDKQAKSRAYWKINQYSGEMYGILPDGTGGGLYQYDSILRQLSTVLEGYAQIIRNTTTKALLSGQAYFASPLSIVILFSITLVRKFAFATEAINIMDAQMIEDEDIKKAFQILACKVAMEIPEKLPGGKGIMPGVNRLIRLISNNNFTCQ